MPNIDSAKRRMRVEAKSKLKNRMVKSELKTLAKKFNDAVSTGDKDVATALYKEYTGALDKAALKGTIHKNSSNRKKAQIAKALGSVTA
ncbi:MAG: 30S ribosomal protein S20 [Eubacteriales bacterium]|nr:30S ribosomal protein S20 [Eubacteriales bacterium]